MQIKEIHIGLPAVASGDYETSAASFCSSEQIAAEMPHLLPKLLNNGQGNARPG